MKKIIYLLILITKISVAQNGNFSQLTYKCIDNIERPYIVYTPKTMNTNAKRPLLVYLHGSISNPNLKKSPLAYIQQSKLIELADRGNFYLMFPYGQKGAAWFDTVGTDMVMGEIDTVKNKFNIDENKIFLSGFSDGGSGTLYFSFIKPNKFAGFIPMNGSLRVVAKLSPNIFPANSNHKPTYIINTKSDILYDINQIRPTIEYLQKFNKNITFKEWEGNHEMSYLTNQLYANEIIDFIKRTRRKPYQTISWESTADNNNSIIGITIKSIDTIHDKRQSWHKPYQLKVFNNKANFGIKYDYSYRGEGLKIADFTSDTASAKRMGMKKKDILLIFEKDTIKNMYSPYLYIQHKKAGDKTTVFIERNGEKKTITGVFNKGFFYNIFDRHDTTAKIKANIKNGKLSIETSKVAQLIIDFNKLKDYHIKQLIVNNKAIISNHQGTQIIKIEEITL